METHRRFRARSRRAPRSACSSAIPGPKARRSSCGRAWTSRSTTATGRSSVRRRSRTRRANQVPRELTRARDGRDSRRVRARGAKWASPPASTCSSCTARTATCSRRSSRRCATVEPTSTAARSRTGCAIRSRSFARCARSGRRNVRCRSASPRPIGSNGGISGDDAVEIARAFKAEGADLIDVSTGQTSPDAKPVYGRMFQTPYADKIRNEVGIATMAVGNITDADQVNAILAGGRADLVALGRPHLADPFWTLHAAAQLGYRDARVAGAVSPRKRAARAPHRARERLAVRREHRRQARARDRRGRGIGLRYRNAARARRARGSASSAARALARKRDAVLSAEADVTDEAQIARAFDACRDRQRPDRDPRQQRGRRRIGAADAHGSRDVGSNPRHEPDRARFSARAKRCQDMLDRRAGDASSTLPAPPASTARHTSAAYCASKHGVVGFTRAIAAEFAAKGMTANAVCPGYTETDMMAASDRQHHRDRPDAAKKQARELWRAATPAAASLRLKRSPKLRSTSSPATAPAAPSSSPEAKSSSLATAGSVVEGPRQPIARCMPPLLN